MRPARLLTRVSGRGDCLLSGGFPQRRSEKKSDFRRFRFLQRGFDAFILRFVGIHLDRSNPDQRHVADINHWARLALESSSSDS